MATEPCWDVPLLAFPDGFYNFLYAALHLPLF